MTRTTPSADVDVRSVLTYLASYLAVIALLLWAGQLLLEDVSIRWFSTFLRITLFVCAVALVGTLLSWDESPERVARVGHRLAETVGLDERRTRLLLYRSVRNLALLTVAIWGLTLSGTIAFRVVVDLGVLFYLTAGVGLLAALVYLRYERGVSRPAGFVWLAFLAALALTIAVESPLGDRYLRLVDPRPIRAGAIVLGTAIALSSFESGVQRTVASRRRSVQSWLPSPVSRTASTRIGPRLERLTPVVVAYRYEIVLAFVLVVGFGLRVYELAALPPSPDEYYHLIAARDVVREDGLISVPGYTRAFVVVTLPVALSFELFGPGLFAARLPMILGNLLAVVPLYLLLTRIDRPTALVASFLYVSNPWTIAVARTVREYAVLPLVLLTVTLGLVWVLERIPRNATVGALHSRYGARSIGAVSIALALPVFYAFVVDPDSSITVVVGLYVVFLGFVIARLDWTDRRTQLAVGLPLLAAVLLSGDVLSSQAFLTATPDYSPFALEMFVDEPPQQWYLDRSITAVLVALVFGGAYTVRSRNPVAVFCTLALCGYVYAFAFHFDRYLRPRYVFHIEIWFVILLAIGVVALARHVSAALQSASSPSRPLVTALTVVFLLVAIVNPGQVLVAATLHDEYGGTYTPITTEHHIDAEAGLSVVPEYESGTDVILIHRTQHLEWYYPSIYGENEVIYYRCNDVDFEDDPVVDELDDSNALLITSWRTNRGNCIEEHPGLEAFESVGEYSHYRVYANFEPE